MARLDEGRRQSRFPVTAISSEPDCFSLYDNGRCMQRLKPLLDERKRKGLGVGEQPDGTRVRQVAGGGVQVY